MTHTLLKKTAFAFGTGCFFGFLALALTTQPANAQTQNAEKSYTAPGESNPTAVAKSKPGKIGGVSVKDKQKQAVVEEAIEEVVLVVEEQPKEEVKPQPTPQIKEEPKAQPKEEAKPQPAPQIKEEPKVQPKEEAKPQPKIQLKEESKAQPKEEAKQKTKQKIALETLKKKVAADKTPKKAKKPAKKSNDLVQKVAYGDTVQDWVAKPGDTVQGLLMKWSEESGWTLIWKLDRDYILEAGVVFRGTYMDVSMALLRSFARAMPAPIGTFYKGNRVLVVSTREDENEG